MEIIGTNADVAFVLRLGMLRPTVNGCWERHGSRNDKMNPMSQELSQS